MLICKHQEITSRSTGGRGHPEHILQKCHLPCDERSWSLLSCCCAFSEPQVIAAGSLKSPAQAAVGCGSGAEDQRGLDPIFRAPSRPSLGIAGELPLWSAEQEKARAATSTSHAGKDRAPGHLARAGQSASRTPASPRTLGL